jgi:signal transduction histidine kinase/CheY-like chemotaxis protein
VFGKRSVIVNSYMDTMKSRPHVIVNEDGINPLSSVAVPMVVMDRVIGTFEVQAYENNAFQAEHVVALEMAANLAAVAIENVRLIQVEASARSEAESANLAKDEFLSVLSHELRTPLNAMLGWVRMLRSDVLDKDSTAKALEVIERNTRLQSSLIEDLLDVSRIISGKMRIETELVDMGSIVNTVSETVAPLALAKGVNYLVERGVENLFMNADPIRIQQVVSNLVQNAIKFTPADGTVRVASRKIGNMAVLTVSDTGIGIEPQFLPYIFDRFRQADASTKRNYTGLGLGLTIARTIVSMHGGEVEVDSEGHGRGSVFTVRMPLAEEFYMHTTAEPPRLATSGSELKGARILLVDDDIETLEPLRLFLEGEDAQTHVVSSGAAALESLATGEFNILISDIGMPEIDGFELIAKLRSSKNGGSSIPAIALTAYASEDDRDKVLGAGFTSHIAKPVNFDEMLQVLKGILKG